MKNLIFLIIFLIPLTLFSQEQCPPPPPSWGQNIKSNIKTWSFHTQFISSIEIDGTRSEANVSKVLMAIRNAILIWQKALGTGTITFIELPVNDQNADINIMFNAINAWGFAPDTMTIYLGYGHITDPEHGNLYEMRWAYYNDVDIDVNDLVTVIAHEFGHIILGPEHYNIPNFVTLMQDMYMAHPRKFRQLHNCEVKIVHQFYPIDEYNVYLANKTIYEDELGGNLIINNTDIYPSNIMVSLRKGIYNFKTDKERKSFNGKIYKHNNWMKNPDFNFLSLDYEIKKNENMIAYFKDINYAAIKVQLEGKNFADKGVLEFQDPWYVLSDGSQPGNHWINATGYYEPTGSALAQEKGVFLDQGLDWQPPYYSVKVASVQNIELSHTGRVHPFYFQGWSASPQGSAKFKNADELETPVVFKQEGATVSANYKGSILKDGLHLCLISKLSQSI